MRFFHHAKRQKTNRRLLDILRSIERADPSCLVSLGPAFALILVISHPLHHSAKHLLDLRFPPGPRGTASLVSLGPVPNCFLVVCAGSPSILSVSLYLLCWYCFLRSIFVSSVCREVCVEAINVGRVFSTALVGIWALTSWCLPHLVFLRSMRFWLRVPEQDGGRHFAPPVFPNQSMYVYVYMYSFDFSCLLFHCVRYNRCLICLFIGVLLGSWLLASSIPRVESISPTIEIFQILRSDRRLIHQIHKRWLLPEYLLVNLRQLIFHQSGG